MEKKASNKHQLYCKSLKNGTGSNNVVGKSAPAPRVIAIATALCNDIVKKENQRLIKLYISPFRTRGRKPRVFSRANISIKSVHEESNLPCVSHAKQNKAPNPVSKTS